MNKSETGTNISRRSLLAITAAAPLGAIAFGTASASEVSSTLAGEIKAITFDVFGTCTDYWTAFTTAGAKIDSERGTTTDWNGVLLSMGGPFPPTFVAVLKKQRPWQSFVSLRRESLQDSLAKINLNLSDEHLDQLNDIWATSTAWPDVAPGLERMKRKYILATLGNADMGDTTRLVKFNELGFDEILTAELALSIKPDPAVYQLGPRYLGVKPSEILMVASHKADLKSAAAQGFRTAFVARPLEFGPVGKVDTKSDASFDFNASSFDDLATQLLG